MLEMLGDILKRAPEQVDGDGDFYDDFMTIYVFFAGRYSDIGWFSMV